MLVINIEVVGVFLLFDLIKKNLWVEEEFVYFLKYLDINFWIIFLVLLLYLIILIVEFSYKLRLNLLFIVLINLILTRNIIVFFFIMR